MALVENPGYDLSFTLQDLDLNKRGFTIRLPDGIVVDDVVAALSGTFQTLLAGISDAVLVGYSLSKSAYDPAAVDAPESSDVERKGSFVFRATNNQLGKMEVPSIKNTLVINKTNQIDTDNAAVAAFVDFILNGLVGLGQPVTNTGASYTSLVSAEKIHRGSSRG